MPLNPLYIDIARRILKDIERRVQGTKDKPVSDNFQVLGVHICGGDNPGHPVVKCNSTRSYPQLIAQEFKFNGASMWGVACGLDDANNKVLLTWQRFLDHLNDCDDEIHFCIDDFDALYFATNDESFGPTMMPSILKKTANSTKIFYLRDFDFVDTALRDHFLGGERNGTNGGKLHPLHQFLVEEAVLMLTTAFQPSIPSSIADIVFHFRLGHGKAIDFNLYME